MKQKILVLGIDDGHFDKFSSKKALIVGAVFRGNQELVGLVSTEILVDGLDSTQKISQLLQKNVHKNLKAIILHGSTFAGFNIVDINALSKRTKKPVICVLRKNPNMKKVLKALDNFKDKNIRKNIIETNGQTFKHKGIYFQCAGINTSKVKQLLDVTTRHSSVPEALRVAHIIASGISRGFSKGRV